MFDVPGKILLLGSGETSHAGGQAYDALLEGQAPPLHIRILETPAGFELNSERVAGRVGDFLQSRLQNFQPEIRLIPARRKGGEFSADSFQLSEELAEADLIFLGPGSPSYAIRQLEGSRVWDTVKAVFLMGAHIALSSAATIAFGKFALPVYEIYKVGEDPFWNQGLNFLALFGLQVSFIPHWNNNDGGSELDTSRCFIGRARFDPLMENIPAGHPLIGLDEQTGLIVDIHQRTAQCVGKGQIHLLLDGKLTDFETGAEFPLDLLGGIHEPETDALLEDILTMAERIRSKSEVDIPLQIREMVEQREAARKAKNWAASDQLRDQLAALGWQVTDTADGPKVELIR